MRETMAVWPVWPVWRWAANHAMTSAAPVWMYRFGRQPPLPADLGLAVPQDGVAGYGAFHTAELLYAWDNLGQRGWPWTHADHAIAEARSSAWARFAAAGDPNGGRLPGWAVFTGKDGSAVMHFADPVRAGTWIGSRPVHVLDALNA